MACDPEYPHELDYYVRTPEEKKECLRIVEKFKLKNIKNDKPTFDIVCINAKGNFYFFWYDNDDHSPTTHVTSIIGAEEEIRNTLVWVALTNGTRS